MWSVIKTLPSPPPLMEFVIIFNIYKNMKTIQPQFLIDFPLIALDMSEVTWVVYPSLTRYGNYGSFHRK